jgi:hypothetical protein
VIYGRLACHPGDGQEGMVAGNSADGIRGLFVSRIAAYRIITFPCTSEINQSIGK